jgi:hypothetical protein
MRYDQYSHRLDPLDYLEFIHSEGQWDGVSSLITYNEVKIAKRHNLDLSMQVPADFIILTQEIQQ